jgi:replicative DNA helicase
MSADVEKVILGSILLDNKNREVAKQLAPKDFSLSSHQRIFSVIGTMLDSGLGVDTTTLPERIGRKELRKLGGVAYVSSLTEGVPRSYGNMSAYVAIVAEAAAKRRATLASIEFQKKLDAGADVEQAAQAFLKRIAPERKATIASPSQACLVRLSDLVAKRVTWLWEPYLPPGMLSIISGDSDVGKSYLMQAVAAGVT